jgi:DNA-binding NarL/FixJ family response regulator
LLKIPSQKPLRDYTVLIIDSQALVHDVIKSALRELGVKNIKSAENAYYALRLCDLMTFDMVIVSFDVKSDKDGFNLLEEMKFKGYITKATSVIFLSADTSKALVNCVVELQPDDFWVKPLDRHKVEKRIVHIIEYKRKLYRLNYCIDKSEHPTAVYYAERQLLDPSLSQYHAHINRLIGECLCHLMEYAEAESFYRKLIETYPYAWVAVGLARTLLKQNKLEEAFELTDELLERDDTRFTTFDILAEYHIEKEDYEKGYDIIKKATELAPRNIERNKKSWNLKRLNHDRLGQYIATQNMAKYAKNSIHDTPDLSLNVIRAAIDLAASLPAREANVLLTKTIKDIDNLEADYGSPSQLGKQLAVIRVRVQNVKNNKRLAEEMMAEFMGVETTPSVEDNLDRVKAFHELGFREQSATLLDKIKAMVENDSFTGQVIGEYLNQESKERREIHYTPQELADMASKHYKNKRYKPAFNLLHQASIVSPNNVNIAISLLKVIAILADDFDVNDEQIRIGKQCITMLTGGELSPAQNLRFKEYKKRIEPFFSGQSFKRAK